MKDASFRNFWAQLRTSVHPEDEPIFRAHPEHDFNLDFPPPAFVGDLAAPIIVLMSNGAYKRGRTEAEFPDEIAVSAYHSFIRSEVTALPPLLDRYLLNARWGAGLPAAKRWWSTPCPIGLSGSRRRNTIRLSRSCYRLWPRHVDGFLRKPCRI
jgi:hypothetical protein